MKSIYHILAMSLFISSCEEPTSTSESFPISEISFDYLQGSDKLFITAKVSQRYMSSSLDSVEVIDLTNSYIFYGLPICCMFS